MKNLGAREVAYNAGRRRQFSSSFQLQVAMTLITRMTPKTMLLVLLVIIAIQLVSAAPMPQGTITPTPTSSSTTTTTHSTTTSAEPSTSAKSKMSGIDKMKIAIPATPVAVS